MSIYSGFATRQQEQQYDEIIASMLYILQKRIVKFYLNQPANDIKFIDLLNKLYTNSKNMQQSKYLQPKLSRSITELIDMLKEKRKNFEDEGMKISIISQIKQKDIKTIDNKTKNIQKVQSNPQTAPQKFISSQRPSQNLQKPLASEIRTNVIKKRGNSNTNYKSVLIEVNSHSQLKQKIDQLNKPLIQQYRTPKRQQITFYNTKTFEKQNDYSTLNRNKQLSQKQQIRHKKQNKQQYKKQRAHASSYQKFQLSLQKQKQEKLQSKQDVRQLIKGYLVKKKKHVNNSQQKKKQQINQIFKI